MPAEYDINIFKDDTLKLSFTITDGSGNPIDLSTKTIQFIVRKGDSAVLTLIIGNGLTLSGAGNNTINLDKSINLTKSYYTYDLKVITGGTDIRTYLSGKFIVHKEV